MPLLMNFGINIIFGASMALVGRQSLAMKEDLISWPLVFVVAFESLIMTPVCTFQLQFFPQWSLFYWFDPQLFPSLHDILSKASFLIILFNFLGALFGLAITRRGVVENSRIYRAICPMIGLFFFSLGILLLWPQTSPRTTTDSYWYHNDPLILGWPGWMGLACYLLGFLFVLWSYSRFSSQDPQWL
jgi:hypothetical protein